MTHRKRNECALTPARACYTPGPFFQTSSGMCLILFAYRVRADAPLIVAANRDEFYARPAALAHRWDDAPHVFAGRDLSAGGTWLGVSTSGRFAAVTNFAETPDGPLPPGSRGDLTANFLRGTIDARSYADSIDDDRYRGFSLLLWDGTDLIYTSNRNSHPRALEPGVHGLSNTHLDGTLWPKVTAGTQGLHNIVRTDYSSDDLMKLLADDAHSKRRTVAATRQRSCIRTARGADLHPRRRIRNTRVFRRYHRHHAHTVRRTDFRP